MVLAGALLHDAKPAQGPVPAARAWLVLWALCGIYILNFLDRQLVATLAAAVQVLIEGWLAFASGTFNPNHGARAVMGLALMMLGPGQYSVDRRLYGRKRIELKR